MSALEAAAPRGYVARAEYDRVVRRCAELEDEAAFWRGPQRAQLPPETKPLRRLFGLSPKQAMMLFVMATADEPLPGHVMRRRCGIATQNSVSQHSIRMRSAMIEQGFPAAAFQSRSWRGYWLTEEGRAWLRERAPEAFPSKGASR